MPGAGFIVNVNLQVGNKPARIMEVFKGSERGLF